MQSKNKSILAGLVIAVVTYFIADKFLNKKLKPVSGSKTSGFDGDDSSFAIESGEIPGEFYTKNGDFVSETGDYYDADGDYVGADGTYVSVEDDFYSAEGTPAVAEAKAKEVSGKLAVVAKKRKIAAPMTLPHAKKALDNWKKRVETLVLAHGTAVGNPASKPEEIAKIRKKLVHARSVVKNLQTRVDSGK